MKLDRILTGLGLLLVIQLGVFALMQRSASESRAKHTLVPGLSEAPVDRIVLGGARPDDSILTLEKNDEVWGLREFDGYPADARAIEALLRTLLVIQAEGPIVSKEQYHGSLEIGSGAALGRLRLFTPDSGEPFTDLTFGSSSPNGAAYVRESDAAEVFEVLGLASWDVRSDPAPWMEQPYLEFPIQNVVAIDVVRNDGSFTLRRTEAGWVADEGRRTRSADTTVVAETLRLLGSLAPVEPAGRTEGELPADSSPLVSIRCEMRGGGETLIQLGTGSSDARITIASPDRTHAAEVWKASVEPLLGLTVENAIGEK